MSVTVAVFLVVVYWDVSEGEPVDFLFRWGFIPCEVTRGRPITDIERTFTEAGLHHACFEQERGLAVFPQKRPILSAATAIFVHTDSTHLLSTVALLLAAGWFLERRCPHRGLGRRYWCHASVFGTYLVGGVSGAIVTTVLDPTSSRPAVGGSGGVAGLLGVCAVVAVLRSERPLRKGGYILALVVIAAALEYLSSEWLAFCGHMLGFLAGAGLAGGYAAAVSRCRRRPGG